MPDIHGPQDLEVFVQAFLDSLMYLPYIHEAKCSLATTCITFVLMNMILFLLIMYRTLLFYHLFFSDCITFIIIGWSNLVALTFHIFAFVLTLPL